MTWMDFFTLVGRITSLAAVVWFARSQRVRARRERDRAALQARLIRICRPANELP